MLTLASNPMTAAEIKVSLRRFDMRRTSPYSSSSRTPSASARGKKQIPSPCIEIGTFHQQLLTMFTTTTIKLGYAQMKWKWMMNCKAPLSSQMQDLFVTLHLHTPDTAEMRCVMISRLHVSESCSVYTQLAPT